MAGRETEKFWEYARAESDWNVNSMTGHSPSRLTRAADSELFGSLNARDKAAFEEFGTLPKAFCDQTFGAAYVGARQIRDVFGAKAEAAIGKKSTKRIEQYMNSATALIHYVHGFAVSDDQRMKEAVDNLVDDVSTGNGRKAWNVYRSKDDPSF